MRICIYMYMICKYLSMIYVCTYSLSPPVSGGCPPPCFGWEVYTLQGYLAHRNPPPPLGPPYDPRHSPAVGSWEGGVLMSEVPLNPESQEVDPPPTLSQCDHNLRMLVYLVKHDSG